MPKAKLVTRASSTSTVTEDTLNKGSALTHAEMDSNLINLRDSSFGIADDSSTVLQVSADKTITIAGSGSITTALSGDTLTISGTDNNTVTALNNQTENRLVTMGSTTTELDGEANLTFDGTTLAVTGNITATTSIANDAISIDDNAISTTRSNDDLILKANGLGIVQIQGTNLNMNSGVIANITSGSSPTDVVDKNYVDTQDAAIASDTLTFTNKTFDANGTGNSLSNVEVADLAASAVVTAAEGIASNDNDTTIPTSAAVKAYADSVGGGSATGLTFVGDDSTGTLISDGETVKIAGGTGITTAMSGDTLTITASGGGASTGDITFTGSTMQSPSNANLTLDPSGTGTIELNANTNVTGSITATTSISNDAISIDDNIISGIRSNDNIILRPNGFGIVEIQGPGGTSTNLNMNGGVIANVTTGTSSGDLATRGFVETGTATLFNKSISADNNTLADIEVDNFKASAIVIESEGIASNDNDTTIPTSAAVKDYVDNAGGGASTGDITFTGSTIQSPSNADITLDPGGTGDIVTPAITIHDNEITTNRTNDLLALTANGTGFIVLGDTGGEVDTNERYGCIKVHKETVDASAMTSFADHRRANTTKSLYTLSGSSTTSDAIFQQNLSYTLLDVNGYSLTGTQGDEKSSGPSNKVSTTLSNNGGSASNLEEGHGMFNLIDTFSFGGSTLTVDHAILNGSYLNAYPNTTVNNGYGYRTYGKTFDFGGGPGVITTFYGFYNESSSSNPTNTYAFYDNANTLSRFGAVILANQASDPSTVADSAHIYAKDVSSSSEVFVRDEAGNVTQISPHNEQGEWQYYSVNEKTGKTVRVNMEKMIRKLEEITGETFIENH